MQPQPNHSPSQNPPISPPKTPGSKAETNVASIIDSWRNHTKQIRDQHSGERAHMIADRKYMEDVMEEERLLWDEERNYLKARISRLEKELKEQTQALDNRGRVASSRGSRDTSMNRIAPGLMQRQSIQQQAIRSSPSNGPSVAGSVDSIPSRGVVQQESGRNADGTPFYAPASRNPSRTFSSDSLPSDTLRVDDITAPRESAIRVTSKELTFSDFGPQSPPIQTHGQSTLDTIPEAELERPAIPESIDISLIQPGLEGVSIKATAVSATFAAKVFSGDNSPAAKLSPDSQPPARAPHSAPLSRSGSMKDRDSKENGKGKLDVDTVMSHPVHRRLTMNAGHTPNHSITKFDFIESGSATPTQAISESHSHPIDTDIHHEHLRRRSAAHFDGAEEERGYGNVEDEDHELTGQLGLTNDKTKDDPFLAQLHERLEEAKKSEGVSPSESMSSQSDEGGIRRMSRARMGDEEDKDKETDDMPPLKLKASTNFGRAFGKV